MAPSPSKLEASGAVGFLDLPPELRNRIYKLCLIADSSIRCAGYLRLDLGKVTSDMSGWDTPPGLVTNLLSTCKQVYQEAMPVLYGNNAFYLHSAGYRSQFPLGNDPRQLPTPVQAMRKVHLGRSQNQVIAMRLLDLLRKFPDLDTVRATVGFYRNFQTPRTMAKALKPVVRDMHAARKGSDRKEAIDVIELELQDQTFAQAVMQILRKSLGLA
ncbi:hypothetical protein CB0940_09589 [Cercospora beticola]|uniref:F-box domain-containing protein n=1 Tax=Cercospora beticola TaxID=122368 RepID=A0A2G5HGG1_CERBT|nr:hypothetical protein CB0940_09589 [Cercospora beticola]PIA91637.1 hypothetical protein CB0940_09589 [Cercospora beticola]WPB06078.1 hypothetical protein RHO25_010735 [Cercospora beticola]